MTSPASSPALSAAKRRGEWVETLFLSRAIALGFQVCRPWGECAHYDFILERDGHFLRVQVKSTEKIGRGQYRCRNVWGGRRDHYSAQHIDFLAAYVLPLDAWYLIPASAIQPSCWIGVYPQNVASRGRYEPFRNAWHLLSRPAPDAPHLSC